ncbi:pre-mRNA-splicing factor CWC22 homolog [Zootermopsis nevadensis]|uniref:pre-mRNA-splicing factor CWC22 homolog n=1 Tax=Zootermopsis nevadensis TaxID=136037 RepID=UPI000B8E6E00|nr:pre-mRNA-splicing factor CWC22 homolog [Zootermopsis nevadensis]
MSNNNTNLDRKSPDTGCRKRKIKYSSSPRNQAGKRKEEYGISQSNRDYNRSRNQRSNRNKNLNEDRNGEEERFGKRESNKFSRNLCEKNENQAAYFKRKDGRDEYEKNSYNQSENASECDRYLSRNDSEFHTRQSDVVCVQKEPVDLLTSRTGGAYLPPAKLRMMQAQITDKSSAAYQRIAWEALRKSIHGHINKVNSGNIAIIVRELLKENIVRGRGLLCRSTIEAQAASPAFTHVYAALVAVINSKFPIIGDLLLRRLVIQFRRGLKRDDKTICISAATFVAHLVNQRVAHEIVALEILTLLVESPTDDSVEIAIAFLKECGMKLIEVSKKGMDAMFEIVRHILNEGQLDKRVQYMTEVIFQVRKDKFRGHEAVMKELDLVEEQDQFTHLITLDDAKDSEDILNVFKFDAEYEANEDKYSSLRKEILDEGSSNSESGSGSEEESESEESRDDAIIDKTETNLMALRKTIYLMIRSSLDFEVCAHRLMRMKLKPGEETKLCYMFLDCCAQQRTYEKFYGLLAQRFCQMNKIFIPPFQQIFRDTYDTIHRLDIIKLRNVAKFFAHLLFTDAISWEVLSFIHLNEKETTSSSRIFIKILFLELSECMGLNKLNGRMKDPAPVMDTNNDGLEYTG